MWIYQKRRAVWRLAGDIRGEGAAILTRLWTSLGRPSEELPEGESAPRTVSDVLYHLVDILTLHTELSSGTQLTCVARRQPVP